MLDQLRDIAIRFQIDPEDTIGHAAKLESVVKVLTKINESFINFLQIEFMKEPEFKKAYQSNPHVLKPLIKDLDLLIVDLKFSSFEAALAPNLLDVQASLFDNHIDSWKNTSFAEFKDEIILADFENPNYIKKITKRYTEKERLKIYQPLFSSLGNSKDFKVNFKNNVGNTIKTFHQPQKEKVRYYTPKIEKTVVEKDYGTYQVFVKAKKGEDISNLKKSDISKLLYFEELEHETYPYKPDLIKFDKKIYSLNVKLDCDVNFEENQYIIHNDFLDITVWGESREEAEEAFNFSFHSTYINYVFEEDQYLSEEAILLKNKIKSIVNAIFDESKKN
ncbi:MAG: hypothetical protein IPP61_05045 [Cytophagaceae bacterium]|nr:hypothetical protein [Cytophagaceae bacterium]MBL0301712.1 hypothetical protein [Cytophagaceae bacterium]MBL0324535.1 hypothetical protein [Cytophagaceae bacterium]